MRTLLITLAFTFSLTAAAQNTDPDYNTVMSYAQTADRAASSAYSSAQWEVQQNPGSTPYEQFQRRQAVDHLRSVSFSAGNFYSCLVSTREHEDCAYNYNQLNSDASSADMYVSSGRFSFSVTYNFDDVKRAVFSLRSYY